MRRSHLMVAGLAATLWASASMVTAQAPADPAPTEQHDEALFDSTTTRGELLDMGRAAANLGNYPLAEKYFQEALIRGPDDVEAMCELSRLYKRTGRLEYAQGLLVRASKIAPLRFDIAEMRRETEDQLKVSLTHEVDSLVAAGKPDEALPRISSLQSLAPDDVDLMARKARCLAAIGQPDAALATLDAAIAKVPREDLHRLRAEISSHRERARTDELEASARRLIDSGNWVYQQAADVLQEILARDPNNQWAREQFRAIAGQSPASSAHHDTTSWNRQLVGAFRDVAPGMVSLFDRHLVAILIAAGAAFLLRSPIARAVARRIAAPSALAGSLERIHVTDVLRLINASALSGVLVLRTPDGRARVYIEDGEPVHCTALGHEGADALIWVVDHVEAGTFDLRPSRGTVEHTIEQPLAILLGGESAASASAEAARDRRKSRMSELLETHPD